MSMRPKLRSPGGYQRDHFHGRYICGRCSAEVHDWQVHDAWHAEQDELLERLAGELEEAEPEDLATRANREGRAVVTEFARPRMFGREAWRQVAACLRLRPAGKAPVPAATSTSPEVAAGRAQQWAAMGDLIKRTTEA